MEKRRKYLSKEDALHKMRHFCAYQERCHQEVRYKLVSLQIYGDDLEDILSTLIQESFLDEERFACAFVRGKFRNNKWGMNKIIPELKRRNISGHILNTAMREIDEEEYRSTLKDLLEKKYHSIQASTPYELKHKCFRFAVQKGYEPELIYDLLPSLDFDPQSK